MSAILFPTVNALLNGLAGVFMLTGVYFIRRKDVRRHRAMMIAAFTTSALFLLSYLAYHFSTQLVTSFRGTGVIRTVYFFVLISHSVLAAAVPVMVLITLWRGLKMKVKAHRRVARWTFPAWLYVSVTGVIVYVMLYHLEV